jgi:hypothetical protein
MDKSSKAAFLALVLTQAIHSVEEYAFEFYQVFRPAQLLDGLFPGFAQPGFIAFNSLLLLFGIWCLVFQIGRNAPKARFWAWVWVVIELYNGAAHALWAAVTASYNPGLVSSLVLFALATYLFLRLRGSSGRIAQPDEDP